VGSIIKKRGIVSNGSTDRGLETASLWSVWVSGTDIVKPMGGLIGCCRELFVRSSMTVSNRSPFIGRKHEGKHRLPH